MRLSRKIARQRNMRIATGSLFIVYGFGTLVAVLMLGGSVIAMLGVQAIVIATGVLILTAPSETMDPRWFHAVPIFCAGEAMLAMLVVSPHGGALAVVFIFNGPLVGFVMETPRAKIAHLTLASVLMMFPVFIGDTDATTTVTVLGAVPVMWGLAVFAAMIWDTAEQQAKQLALLAQHDALTGVANRRLLEERLEYEFSRHARWGRALTVIMLDLDGFKQVNDILGHSAGDELLRQVAKALTGAVREQDTVARQGGDEFCVLAPETAPQEAHLLVARIKKALGQLDAMGQPLSAGVGFATFPFDAGTEATLLEAADARQRADKPVAIARAWNSRLREATRELGEPTAPVAEPRLPAPQA
jgi:diguanylate cyclase (GGDEF)-like protein